MPCRYYDGTPCNTWYLEDKQAGCFLIESCKFSYIIMYTCADAREYSFYIEKKRVIEVEGFHLNYTLFPSNKIDKENKKNK